MWLTFGSKGLNAYLDITGWRETAEIKMTTPPPSVRALVIRWPGPESDSSISITKENGKARFIRNPRLKSNESIVVVLQHDEGFLIYGKVHLRWVVQPV